MGEGVRLHDDALDALDHAMRVLERERLQLGQSAGANGVEEGHVVVGRGGVVGADVEVPILSL